MAVTPLRATPRPAGGSGSSRITVTCPTPTPATSAIELVGPGSSAPMRRPWARSVSPGLHGRGPYRRLISRPVGLALPVVWSDRHRLHEPGGEVWVGVRTPGTELPARAERIREALSGQGASFVARRAAARRGRDQRARPRARRLSRPGLGGLGGVRPDRGPGPGPGGALPLSPSRAVLRPPAPHRHRDERARRAVRLRHDDADRPGHVGGGPGGARRGGHRGRPRAGRRARWPTPAVARPDTT